MHKLFKKNTQKNSEGTVTNVISNSAKNGLIPQKDYFDKDIANADNTAGYYIISKNDFVYNPRKSADAPYGPISRYTYDEDGIVSPLYLCFRGDKDVNSEYFERYFRSSVWHRYIYMSGDSGARHDRVSIKDETFFEMPIHLPSNDEQKRIAAFLNLLEQKIAVQVTLVENLKKYKRGVSNKVFDAIHNDSSCTKELFSNIFVPLQNNTFSRECLTNEKTHIQNIHYGDILVKYGSVIDMEIDVVPFIKHDVDIKRINESSYLQDGDIIFADTAEDYTVGKMSEIIGAEGRKIISGLHTMPYRSTIHFVPMYLGYYLNSDAYRTQILPMIQGTKVSSISKSEIGKTSVYIPNIEKQKRIVNVLHALDKKISRSEAVLESLKAMKKGLLQKLFI